MEDVDKKNTRALISIISKSTDAMFEKAIVNNNNLTIENLRTPVNNVVKLRRLMRKMGVKNDRAIDLTDSIIVDFTILDESKKDIAFEIGVIMRNFIRLDELKVSSFES